MDYLSFLPVEVWRKIFLELPIYRTIGVYQSTDPLMFRPADNFAHDKSKEQQKMKAKLLLICKSLYPLMVTLLYSEVLLSNESKVWLFLRSLARFESHSTGNITRCIRIHLLTTPQSQLGPMLDSLTKTCPNITSLHFINITKGVPIEVWRRGLDEWGKNLVDLNWYDLGYTWPELFAACQGMSGLRTLTIDGDIHQDSDVQDLNLTFPTVKRLCLRHPVNGVTFPSLESLHILGASDSTVEKFANIITTHKRTLRTLEIIGGLGRALLTAPMLGECNLKTLITSSAALRWANSLSNIKVGVMVESLDTLYVRISFPDHLIGLGIVIERIKLLLFPQLEYIVIILNDKLKQAELEALQAITVKLSGMVVTTRIDPYSSI
jgi:hypothetical protein